MSSNHRQPICDLGRDLSIEARSIANGIVEAIRPDRPGFVLGIRWHPKFHPGLGLLDAGPIPAEFLAAAGQRTLGETALDERGN